MNAQLIETARIVSAGAPVNITGAGLTAGWVGMKYHHRCAVLIQTGAWAGGTAAVTLQQATAVAGTGAKALAMAYYWLSSTTSDVPVKTAVTSNTFNLTAANQLAVIEVTAYDLDFDQNGFAYLQAVVGSPGANADFVSISYVLYDQHYDGLASTLPSVLT